MPDLSADRGRGVDVTVAGTGLIGLAVALALADLNLRVRLIGEARPGESSPAGAGMLAPSLEDAGAGAPAGPVHRFSLAALDRYVAYVGDLTERSGVRVDLSRRGILRVALDDPGAVVLRQRQGADSEWLDAASVLEREPGLRGVAGGLLYPSDGAVDNVALLKALDVAIARMPNIERLRGSISSVVVNGDGARCTMAGERTVYAAPHLVLAAGAWVGEIRGLPRALPIEPVRGQMFSIARRSGDAPTRVVYGPHAYLVPRGDMLLVGATMERVGFDVRTTDAALAELRAGAAALWPPIATAATAAEWAGLRPVTPDLLPIIGPDPDHPALIYACGHSRHGILMAPLTGDCVAALVAGAAPPADLHAFRVERFPRTSERLS
jgi:glycine oxidase